MAEITLSSGSICRPYRTPWGSFHIEHCVPISTAGRIDIGRVVHTNYTAQTSSSAGQIVPSTADNTFNTNVKFNANKTIYFSPGFFSVNLPDVNNLTGVLFLFRDNFTLTGSGWNTIVQQPRRMIAVASFNDAVVDGSAPGATNVFVANMQFTTPANPRPSTGGESCIAMGNSVNVTIDSVFFNGCYGIDWTFGGNANPFGIPPTSYHCDNASAINCVSFNNRLDDNIKGACVNVRSWRVIGCSFLEGASFDIEQNTRDDDQSDFVVDGCLFHGGGSLLVQGPQGRYGTISGCMFEAHGGGSTAINLNSSVNVSVVGNLINGYNGSDINESGGIFMSACNNCSILNNTVLNCSLVSNSPNPANAPPINLSKCVGTTVSGNVVASPEHGWSAIHEDAECSGTVLYNNRFGLGSGSTITVTSENSRFGSISAASAGATLPQATIFSPVCAQLQNIPGTFTILTNTGLQTVTYTGVTAVAFTGCSGGTGTMFLGPEPDISLLGQGTRAWNNTIAVGDGSSSIVWSKDAVVSTSTFAGHRTVSGAAQVATVADSIIGVDTTSVACDITLPDPAVAFVALTATVVNASWEVLIQDEANNAAAKNITIKRANPATKINGVAADKVISTNSGALSFYTNGTDWFAR